MKPGTMIPDSKYTIGSFSETVRRLLTFMIFVFLFGGFGRGACLGSEQITHALVGILFNQIHHPLRKGPRVSQRATLKINVFDR